MKETESTDMFRYVHINMIAKDHHRLIDFYKNVLNYKSIGEVVRAGPKHKPKIRGSNYEQPHRRQHQ